MDILTSLGLNSTVLLQFLIFLFTYIVFSQLLFKPYLALFLKRAQMTDFSDTAASHLIGETKDLSMKYETKARDVNDQISQVFESARLEAQGEYDEIVRKAREEAEKTLAIARVEIEKKVQKVRAELVQEIPNFSVAIANKLLGKESKA